MATTYLNRAFSSSSTNTKATWSLWVKRSKIGANQFLFQSRDAENNNYRTYFSFTASDTLRFYSYDGSGNFLIQIETNKVFRDTSAWYHIVFRVDTTQGNTSHRIRTYVNGEEETSFSTATYPSSSAQIRTVSSNFTRWGKNYSSYDFFDGVLSHINFIEGEDRTPDFFGETDSTTGEWKIKTSPTGFTYGSNGYFILKDGNSVTDQSGNSNNFIVAGGILNNTEDCPSNNFATWNATDRWLGNTAGNGDFLRNGNNYFRTTSDANKALVRSTIGVTSGKYYCEMKVTQIERAWVGICNRQVFTSSSEFWTTNNEGGFFWYGNGGGVYNANNQTTGNYGGFTNNDIVMMALDMDNYAWYLGKNGTWLNSGDPTSGASKTGSVTEETNFGTTPLTNYDEVFFMAAEPSAAGIAQVEANFGNGVFKTTAVASAGTNASGIGVFEYDVPTGYTALSTKGLNL